MCNLGLLSFITVYRNVASRIIFEVGLLSGICNTTTCLCEMKAILVCGIFNPECDQLECFGKCMAGIFRMVLNAGNTKVIKINMWCDLLNLPLLGSLVARH